MTYLMLISGESGAKWRLETTRILGSTHGTVSELRIITVTFTECTGLYISMDGGFGHHVKVLNSTTILHK